MKNSLIIELKVDTMASTLKEITFKVDSLTARRYKSASAREQQKIQSLVKLIVGKRVVDVNQLKMLMDEIGNRAKKRGMTTRIARSLLSES